MTIDNSIRLECEKHYDPERPDILSDFTLRISNGYHSMIEENFKLILNPKPKHIPATLWKYICGLVLTVQARRTK